MRNQKLNRIIKRTLPVTAGICFRLRLLPAIALIDKYLMHLQGKGSGVGWDLNAEILAAEKFIRDKAVVFDVGANKGEWFMAMSSRLGAGVKFVLIEPQADCAEILRKLRQGTVVIQSAISDRNGTVSFYDYAGKPNLSSLHKREDSLSTALNYEVVDIPARTLDSIIEESGYDRVDYIKMDLEGHDFFGMRGAQESIRSGKVGAMGFEFGLSNVNSKVFFRDIWEFLTRFNCRIYRVLPGGSVLRIPQYHEDLEHFSAATNYIAAFD